MAVKIWNRTTHKLSVPGASGQALRPGEAREYPELEYDELINRDSIRSLLRKHAIKLQNQDNMDVRFAQEWNYIPHLTIGDFEYWVDSTGVTRVVEGTPSSDTDGAPLGGAASRQLEAVYADEIQCSGRNFASIRSNFFTHFRNKSKGDWDSLYQYCYWSITYDGYNPWTEWQQFSTTDDLFTFIEATVPSSGGVYTAGAIRFHVREEVDPEDTFPQKLVHRNSLVASIVGRNRYTRRAQQNYGVDSAFDSPAYYTNYYGELAQRFVQADTGVLPATNNNNAIWHTRRVRSLYNLPKVGSYIDALPNLRAAAWDTVGNVWVSPAPTSLYTVQAPFLLMEQGRRRILNIDTTPAPATWGKAATQMVSALVFPLLDQGSSRYKAYAIYPYGSDSFMTESIDTTAYEIVLKCVYRHSYRSVYHVIDTPWYTSNFDGEHMMWSHWKLISQTPFLVLQSLLATKAPESIARDVDSNSYPEKVYLARRNKETGARSAWYPLYSIRRRIPHAAYMIEPARYQ